MKPWLLEKFRVYSQPIGRTADACSAVRVWLAQAYAEKQARRQTQVNNQTLLKG